MNGNRDTESVKRREGKRRENNSECSLRWMGVISTYEKTF